MATMTLQYHELKNTLKNNTMNINEFMNQLIAKVISLTGVQITEENQHEAILDALATVQPMTERLASVEELLLETAQSLNSVIESLPKEFMTSENVKSIALEVIGESGKTIQTALESKITQVSKDFGVQIMELQEKASANVTGQHIDTGVEGAEVRQD